MIAPPPPIELPVHRGAVTVRQGSLRDDLDALHVGDALWWGKEFMAERIASTPPGTPYTMLVGELDGVPVADAFVLGQGVKARGYAMADLYVLPVARGRGVGTALRDALTGSTRAYGLPGWSGSIPQDDQRSLAVAERWGLERMGHHRESVLELDSLDPADTAAAVARAERAGFRLEPLPDHADEDAWRQVYDLMTTVWVDTPDAEGATEQMPYEVFRGFFPRPGQLLLAWRGDRPVGLTAVIDRTKDHAVNTFFTGVVRDARGGGLATALKARHALLLRDQGERRIYTQNMDQNAPILAANARLGFTVDSGFYDYGLAVAAEPR